MSPCSRPPTARCRGPSTATRSAATTRPASALRPIQAYIGQASADGTSFSGRLLALNTSNAGASPGRNVFAFSALRAAPAAPGNPGVPTSPAGPASIAGTHQINGNGFIGPLQLNQAPDGMLSGTVYGNPIEGHYAAGTGSIAFIRYSAPGQPFQLFVGSVTAQGMRGELLALNGGAGASLQRMRYEWSAPPPPAAVAAPALLAPRANLDLRATAPMTNATQQGGRAINSRLTDATVTISCPTNAAENGDSRHTGWTFETIWQVLLDASVANPASMGDGTAITCRYGDPTRSGRDAIPLVTLNRNAGFGITAAMCSVGGGAFNCQGIANVSCPSRYLGDVTPSRQRPGWMVSSLGGLPLLRAEAIDPRSMNAGTVLRCLYGVPATDARGAVMSLHRNAGAGIDASACTVAGAVVTCRR